LLHSTHCSTVDLYTFVLFFFSPLHPYVVQPYQGYQFPPPVKLHSWPLFFCLSPGCLLFPGWLCLDLIVVLPRLYQLPFLLFSPAWPSARPKNVRKPHRLGGDNFTLSFLHPGYVDPLRDVEVLCDLFFHPFSADPHLFLPRLSTHPTFVCQTSEVTKTFPWRRGPLTCFA